MPTDDPVSVAFQAGYTTAIAEAASVVIRRARQQMEAEGAEAAGPLLDAGLEINKLMAVTDAPDGVMH